ncbi:NAD(P)-dependent oxidoreductase [Variovorax sp. LT1R16]|uniref:NAD(P)-dependent oxidoreductase n=1 Tax=Variovorax sp. LT1R16 TaxID=3443728 RepID=UPI003F464B8B
MTSHPPSSRPRVGFIGLGLLGSAMAHRLLAQGWALTVWNLESDRVAPLVAAGAVAAPNPAGVAAASDIVLLCVLDGPAVQACVFGNGNGSADGGIASAGPAAGKLLLDHSTITPDATRAMAARLAAETGMGWVDAPVSGGPMQARDGTLTLMTGGSEADIARARPVFADLAANCTRMGPVGAGQAAKTINQAIVGTGYVLMAEALVLAEAAGIAAADLPRCLAGGLADSGLLQKIYPQMQARDFAQPRGYARQLLKDMRAVQALSSQLQLDLPLVAAATARYAAYVGRGNETADSASVVRLYDEEGGRNTR